MTSFTSIPLVAGGVMYPMAFPWAALMDMHPRRVYHLAWFVYGWVEREHLLNVTACADWWMRAIGLSAAGR